MAESMSINLEGIWIPIDILSDERLTPLEKIIMGLIDIMDKNNPYSYCAVTNEFISRR